MAIMDDNLQSGSQKHNNEAALEAVRQEFQLLLDSQTAQIQRLADIGIALSAERDTDILLEMIIDEAMAFSNADAGTLYVVDYDRNELVFQILKNQTLKIHAGGTSGQAVTLPPVPLEIDGLANLTNASSQAALTGEVINIPDVYEAIGLDFSGTKKYDAQTGYRSKSMLVVPMKNHENEIIGVLQLLNAKVQGSDEVVPFPKNRETMIISLASQAAVALENARLIAGLQGLFDAFIESIATAIDEKSAYTAGHIRRVAKLTMMIASQVNKSNAGVFEDTFFNEDEMEELRVAAWLHDVGKITTPEYVVDKATKLQGIFDRLELVEQRFALIAAQMENATLQQKVQLLQSGNPDSGALQQLDDKLTAELAILKSDLEFIARCNLGFEFLDNERLERIQRISHKNFQLNGETHPYLTDDELKNLSIRKGTLTDSERKIIENHVLVSIKMLKQVPFPRKMSKVPEYAGGHHEKLDGSGYPFGLTADQLALQSRIMAIADIFEALTAKDRPYKKPMKLSQALSILRDMCDRNHIDRDVFDLFMNSGEFMRYAREELNQEQIDVEINKEKS